MAAMLKLALALTLVLVSTTHASLAAGQGGPTLTLEKAQAIAAKTAAYAKGKGWKVSIAITNSEGNLVLFQRGDDSYSGSIDASIQKARSSNAFQRPTSAFVAGVKEGRTGLLSVKDVVAIEGGVPILVDGKHAGAIGVSGARSVEDEEAALAGVK